MNNFKKMVNGKPIGVDVISPASGHTWTVQHALSKIWVRSPYRSISYLSIIDKRDGKYGDTDISLHVEVNTFPLWDGSPEVELIADFPLHITGNYEILSGFKAGIEDIPAKPFIWEGVVRVHTGDEIFFSPFFWSDITRMDLEKMEEYILHQIEREANKVWLSSKLKEV